MNPLPSSAHTAPQRTCVGCRRTRPSSELLRIAATPDGVKLDLDRRLPGRGAHLCPDPDCVEAAVRRGALQRALPGAPHDEVTAVLAQVTAHLSSGQDQAPTEEQTA